MWIRLLFSKELPAAAALKESVGYGPECGFGAEPGAGVIASPSDTETCGENASPAPDSAPSLNPRGLRNLEILERIEKEGGRVFGCFVPADGAAAEGRLVAYASVTRQSAGRNGQYRFIEQLYVHPAYRRQGIGTSLFLRCAATALEWGAKKVYVYGCTEEGIKFFQAVGCTAPEEYMSDAAHPLCRNASSLEFPL